MTNTLLKLIDPGPGLTVADLQAFEEEIGGCLPDDYKQFLLKQNGGWAEPPLRLEWNDESHMIPDFRRLLPISEESGLRLALNNLRELGVDGFLPITSTLNQEDICLAIRGEIGAVQFAFNEYENDVRVGVNLVPLANSFTAFLGGLEETPEPYCRIEELGKQGTKADLDSYLAEGHSLDATGRHGFTIVCEAIKYKNRNLIEECISYGASLSKAVYLAVVNRHPELVKRFVEAGADVNELGELSIRPLSAVPGTGLPGKEGEENRAMYDLLVSLGAKR